MPLTFRGGEHAVQSQQDLLPSSPIGGEPNAAFANFTATPTNKINGQKFSDMQTVSAYGIYGEKPVAHLPLTILSLTQSFLIKSLLQIDRTEPFL